jgi:hypothetical protein
MIIATVCRSGGEYKPAHANALARQIYQHTGERLTVLTDFLPAHFDDVVIVEQSRRNWSGWWSKIELFERFDGSVDPVLYMDLDTIVLGDCRDMVSTKRLIMLADVYRAGRCGSGIMTWADDYSRIAQDFEKRSARVMRDYVTRRAWGDQAYIESIIGKDHAPRIQDMWPGRAISYKAEYLKQGRGSEDIIYFHGRPRPWSIHPSVFGIDYALS